MQRQRVSSNNLHFAKDSDKNYIQVRDLLQETQDDLKTISLQQAINHYKSPAELSSIIESLVNEGLKNYPLTAPLS